MKRLNKMITTSPNYLVIWFFVALEWLICQSDQMNLLIHSFMHLYTHLFIICMSTYISIPSLIYFILVSEPVKDHKEILRWSSLFRSSWYICSKKYATKYFIKKIMYTDFLFFDHFLVVDFLPNCCWDSCVEGLFRYWKIYSNMDTCS